MIPYETQASKTSQDWRTVQPSGIVRIEMDNERDESFSWIVYETNFSLAHRRNRTFDQRVWDAAGGRTDTNG